MAQPKMTGRRSVMKGRDFERWLATYYGKSDGLASRHGFVVENDGKQSGVDVMLEFAAIQAKKGVTAVPAAVREPLAAATRHSGRRIPLAALAVDGDNLGHYIVMRGRDFKRIVDLLREHNLSEQLLVGSTFGAGGPHND